MNEIQPATKDEIEEQINNELLPATGAIYRHYKGAKYIVMGCASVEADPKKTLVIYKKINGNRLWARPLFKEDGADPFYDFLPRPNYHPSSGLSQTVSRFQRVS